MMDSSAARVAARFALVACVAGPLWMAGCSEDDDYCDRLGAPVGPMFSVTVVDSISGEAAWWGATGTIQDGAFQESLLAPSSDPADSNQLLPLYSQSHAVGTYTVTIQKPGYADWVRAGLEVRKEGCFHTYHTLEARLQPTP